MGSSIKGHVVGKKAKKLTKKEIRDGGEFGLFAVHLAKLLKERELTAKALSDACKAAKIDIEEYSVRSWLRAESMPKSHQLRAIGKVLGLEDSRHILPE